MINDHVECETDDNNNDKIANTLAGAKDRIIVEEIEEEILGKILNFIYSGTTRGFDLHCVQLLKAASLYQVRRKLNIF